MRPSIENCYAHQLTALQDALLNVNRRTLVFTAGALKNENMLKGLGSAETATWCEGRRAADPEYKNPYWPD